MNAQPTTWRAVVVRPQLTWLAGERGFTHIPTVPGWQPADLVHVAGSRWFQGEGVVLLCPPPDEVKDRDRVTAEMLAAAKDLGWTATDVGKQFGWFTFRRDLAPMVHLGIAPWISQARTSLFDLDDSADVIARRLARYHELTGAAWRGTAGLSGCAGIRRHHEEFKGKGPDGKPLGGVPLWRWDNAPADVVGCSYELRGGTHQRPASDAERRLPYVQHYDTRAQYLASAGISDLPWGRLDHVGPCDFDPAVVGYWQLRRDQLPASDTLGLIVRHGDSPLVWVTTPVMTWLHELGCRPEVMDAWTSRRAGRLLRDWSERIRDARFKYDPGEIEPAIKDTYARTIGTMARHGGRIYRPDWRDLIVDRARINVLRKIHASGLKPLRYNVDSVWIATQYADPEIDGFALGAWRRVTTRYGERVLPSTEIGKFKHESTYKMADYLATYEGDK